MTPPQVGGGRMRLWILFAGGVLVLAGALWPFGKKTEPLGPVPAEPAVAAAPSAPKPLPPKVIEVIDLARAYEPVPEPDEPAGINPASFIAEPRRIPPAMTQENESRSQEEREINQAL